MKKRLASQFGVGTTPAQEIYMELKKVVQQIPEIEAVSSSLGGLDTHADIK